MEERRHRESTNINGLFFFRFLFPPPSSSFFLFASAFYKWMMSDEARAAPGTQFAVFGLGNKQTHSENFCVVGRNVDRRLGELGAERFVPRVDGDDSGDMEAQFDEWQQGLLDKLESAASVQAEVAGSAGPGAAGVPEPAPPSASYMPNKTAAQRSPTDMFQALCAAGFFREGTVFSAVTANLELSPNSTRSTAELHLDARVRLETKKKKRKKKKKKERKKGRKKENETKEETGGCGTETARHEDAKRIDERG